MQIHLFIILVMISTFHGSCESAGEVVAPSSGNHESLQKSAAPSRVKRGDYRMLVRLGRGLNGLRLGKRRGQSFDDMDRFEPNQVLAKDEGLSYARDMSPEEYFSSFVSLDDSYEPSNLRYRRSTPSDNAMVTPVPFVKETENGIEDDDMVIPDDSYLWYPDWVDGDDSLEGEDSYADASSIPMFQMGKRQIPMIRLGKRGDSEDMKRSLHMLRLGKRQDENVDSEFTDTDSKRSLPMLRLGKKRNLNMLRLGKRLSGRGMNMLRLGKRNLNMLRLGKRQLNMLRLGKRNLNMLRLGKRQLKMLRLGKREDGEDTKRNLQMLRLGKRPVDTDKRNLKMLRLGKRSVAEADSNKEQ